MQLNFVSFLIKRQITELSTGLIPLHRKYEEKKKRQKTPKKEGQMQK